MSFRMKAKGKMALICVLAVCGASLFVGCGSSGGDTVSNGDANSLVEQAVSLEVSKITLDKSTAGLYEGKTIQLTAKLTPSEASNDTLSWTSSDETVALVNSEGYVTGVKAGYANIICRASNGVEASCTVTVKKEEDSKDSKTDNNAGGNSGGNTYNYYYGHFNPNYTYNPSDFVFPDSSVRKLSYSEISATLSAMSGASVSGSFAQDAINEIYARNGYIFKNNNIRAYYESKPWYYKDPGFTTSDFNEFEKYNIDLLTDY